MTEDEHGPTPPEANWQLRLAAAARGQLERAAERYPKVATKVIEPSLALTPRLRHDDIATNAAALTYGAFLSIPPILLLALSVAGFLIRSSASQKALVDAVEKAIPGIEDVAASTIERAVEGRTAIGAIALLGVLWTASGMGARARHALGLIFNTEWTGISVGRLRILVVALPLGAGMLVLMGATSFVTRLGAANWAGIVFKPVGLALLVAAQVLYMILVYRLLTPGHGISARDHLPGALLFAACWFALELVGTNYVASVIVRSSALYGTLGSIFGLMAFLYMASYAFLVSAELSAVLHERRTREKHPGSRSGDP